MKKTKSELGAVQVVVLAGGEAKRMGLNIPKALIKLGNSTLIDRCVNLFAGCGFRDFVFLLGHNDEKVSEHIGKSFPDRISVKKSYDPAQRIAKGKAVKHAIISGILDRSKRSIIAFPDDLYFDGKLPKKIFEEHANSVKKLGTIASMVVTSAQRYPYGVAKTNAKGIVTSFEEKPLVPILTTTGMYLFEPEAYRYFIDLIDMNKKGPVEFESVVIPKLVKEGKIYAIVIPPESWLAVNTIKELEQAQKLVETGVLPKS